MGAYNDDSIYNGQDPIDLTPYATKQELEQNGKGLFITEYGQTTYADTLSAYNEGKIILLKKTVQGPNGDTYSYYPLLYYSEDSEEGNEFIFGRCNFNGSNSFSYYQLHILGGWGSEITSPLVTIDSALDSTSENAVQNKVIYSVIGDVESLLANL